MSMQGSDIDISAKVDFLGRASSYAHRPDSVEKIQTHMSWVFLTDRFVYKLKKPVRLDFLDFSTLAQRHVNCLEELRLNRRLAGDVYLGVIPLTIDASGKLELGGRGETVDWLVKMRRLPRESMLDVAIEEHRVNESQVRRFATVLAAFYQKAEVSDLSPEEYLGKLESVIHANDKALSEPVYHLPGGQIGKIRDALSQYLLNERNLFFGRVRSRHVIEAHGDLRPEHVCLTEPPIFIDCLEFRRSYRMMDKADELAFLAMECDYAGAPFIGPVLFDTYRQCTGDDPPGSLACFFKIYRAQLRAKLSIWHLKDDGRKDAGKWVARARDYLQLAVDYSGELP